MARLGAPLPSGRQWVYNDDGVPLGWVLGKPLATSSRGAVKVWHWKSFRGGVQGTESTRRHPVASVVSAAEASSQN